MVFHPVKVVSATNFLHSIDKGQFPDIMKADVGVYHARLGIPGWIISNLCKHGNCSIREKNYQSLKENYIMLFGDGTLSHVLSNNDRRFIVLSVTKEGIEIAHEYMWGKNYKEELNNV